MMRVLNILFLLGTLVFIQGCSTTSTLKGQSFYHGPASVSEDKATIYFYRPPHPIGNAVTQNISIDGVPVGTLPDGSYFVTEVAGGTHEVVSARSNWIDGNIADAKFPLTVEVGKTYFVTQQTSQLPYNDDRSLAPVYKGSFGLVTHYFRWARVPQKEAEIWMQICRRSPVLKF